jgi:hypothetical protein
MVAGPIPWCALKMYADEMNFDTQENRDDFFYILRRMDNEYLKELNSKNAKPTPTSPKTRKPSK